MNPGRSMKHTRRVFIGLLAILALGFGAKYGRYHVWPKRFAVVEPGRIYRGGEQEFGPYQRLMREHGIRTIVTLLDVVPDDRHERVERQLVQAQGLKQIRIPMPGNGLADFDDLDRAVAALAEPSHAPVFVHCSAGVHRTGAAVAAYRMKVLGWGYDRAMAELERHWVSRAEKPDLFAHLKRYFDERVRDGSSAAAAVTHRSVPGT